MIAGELYSVDVYLAFQGRPHDIHAHLVFAIAMARSGDSRYALRREHDQPGRDSARRGHLYFFDQ
jgi:hypothetical protein